MSSDMVTRTSGNFPKNPYIPKEPTYRAVKPRDVSASILLTPLNPQTSSSTEVPLTKPLSPQPEPSCFDSICNTLHQFLSWICKCVQCIFCCCPEEKEGVIIEAQNLVNHYNNEKNKSEKYANLKKLAILYTRHSEIKQQYDIVVANLDDQDLSICQHITLDQIKQSPDSLIRAADYISAYFKKEGIIAKNKTKQGMIEILNLSIENESDRNIFKQKYFNAHKVEMLEDSDKTLSLEEFLRKI